MAGIRPGECRVWWASVVPHDDRLLGWLDDTERERHRRYVRAADRDRYLTAHALVRAVVGAEANIEPPDVPIVSRCRRCGGDHGKPVAEGTGLAYSLSHSGGRVAVAVTRGVEVGVDVEHVAGFRDHERLARAVLTATERAALAALPADRRAWGLLRYWTRKEAAVKATGDGIAAGVTRVEVTPPDDPAAVVRWGDPTAIGPTIHLADLRGDHDHVACVATVEREVTVTEHDGDGLLVP